MTIINGRPTDNHNKNKNNNDNDKIIFIDINKMVNRSRGDSHKTANSCVKIDFYNNHKYFYLYYFKML